MSLFAKAAAYVYYLRIHYLSTVITFFDTEYIFRTLDTLLYIDNNVSVLTLSCNQFSYIVNISRAQSSTNFLTYPSCCSLELFTDFS